MSPPVLFQFRASHYNEKARWALDWKGIAHERRTLLPGFHVPQVLWMTGQKQVPVLVVDGEAITDSTRIIAELERRHPDPPLYPADSRERQRALELEELFDAEIGPHLRRALFALVLDDADFVTASFAGEASPLAQGVFRACFPLTRTLMRFDMGIDEASAARSRTRLLAALDRLEAAIGPSGHLVGDHFTVADLTGAALLSPIVMPPEFPYAWPARVPDAASRWRDELAGRPAFAWVQDVYRRYRGRSHALGEAA